MTTQQLASTHHDGEIQGELLTPGAAARLFRISESAVRAARLRGNVASPVVMGDFRQDRTSSRHPERVGLLGRNQEISTQMRLTGFGEMASE